MAFIFFIFRVTPWQVRYPYTKGVMCFRPKSPSRASKYPWGRPQHWATPTARRAVNWLRLLTWLSSAHSDPTLVMDAASQVTAPKPHKLVRRQVLNGQSQVCALRELHQQEEEVCE